ncbi:hypothetical protein [uncultured Massilia sp.]|uniref:hypothetical protein n=1 Tax=uncultured Massilia sp. TaxID=169973 RepID=UPI002584DAA3|nr:hypothetical protein [uncultured Massilia sp.]
MLSWMQIIDIGHTAVMVPLVGAIAAWLVLGRAWKLAAWWCLIFATGLGIVAASKIAYLGWGMQIPALGFKALSGHAWRATAVLPVLFWVVLQDAPARWRMRGALLGVLLGAALAGLLVVFGFHTASEVIPSFALGIGAGLAFLRAAACVPAPAIRPWVVPLSLASFVLIFSLKPSSISPRLVDVALFFSGREEPYRWKDGSKLSLPHKQHKSC